MKTKIVVATRASKLAYGQTLQTVESLRLLNPGVEFEIKTFSTKGDKDRVSPLTEFGGTGVFVKELEDALLRNEADIAIHSSKDVPNDIPEGLQLVSYPKRENPADVVICKGDDVLATLKPNPVIGTGSLRRRIQISNIRPDASFIELRGNIDTRLKKLDEGQCDAIVLAAAGLNRLGVEYKPEFQLSEDECLPAIGQGAIVIECRSNDKVSKAIARSINHRETRIAVSIERHIMAEIEGGCKFPLAAYATVEYGDAFFTIMAGDYETGEFIKVSEKACVEKSYDEAIKLAKKVKEICAKKNIILKH